jgi:hypothetical protein
MRAAGLFRKNADLLADFALRADSFDAKTHVSFTFQHLIDPIYVPD